MWRLLHRRYKQLKTRIYEHKNKLIDGFSKKYNLTNLVYYEIFDSVENAILMEKYLKGKKREFKIALIENLIILGEICMMKFVFDFFGFGCLSF